jgi:hypothetical protein
MYLNLEPDVCLSILYLCGSVLLMAIAVTIVAAAIREDQKHRHEMKRYAKD